jgi:hypothetical protein
MGYVLDWLQINKLVIPVGQVFGFKAFQTELDATTAGLATTTAAAAAAAATANAAAAAAAALAGSLVFHVNTVEGEIGITSGTYVTFSGPILTSLDPGQYFVAWGGSMLGDDAASGSSLLTTVQPNGSGAGNPCEQQNQNYYSSCARGDVVTLSAGAGSNTLEMIALSSIAGHTGKIRHAWIAAAKFA